LAAGGLEHWLEVARGYSAQTSVRLAAEAVKRLLDSCTGTENQAFGLVCGFEASKPTCFRINRFHKTKASETCEEDLCIVQPLGVKEHTEAAKNSASLAIASGRDMLRAVVESIQARFPGTHIRPPIHVWVLRPGV
jgi:hypothetical protein